MITHDLAGGVDSPFRDAEAEGTRWGDDVVAPVSAPLDHEADDRPTLRRGTSGTAVATLQSALTAAGFPTVADGDFGRSTERNVRAFQSSRGLDPDGVVGQLTWSGLLRAGERGGGPVGQPSTGDRADGTPDVALGILTVDTPGWPGFTYQFTRDDLIWTAKLIVYEAGGDDDPDNAAVLWAMFNRYALFTHRYYSTFESFIRRYSTTLQPVLRSRGAAERHYKKGDAVYRKTGGCYEGTNIPKGQLVRHLEIQRAPWSAVKASARELATRALTGRLPNPGIGLASEFASTMVYYRQRHGRRPTKEEWIDYTNRFARSKKWTFIGEVGGIDPTKNAFFVQNRVSHLPKDAVRVEMPGQASGSDPDASAGELLAEFEESESDTDDALSSTGESSFNRNHEMPPLEAMDAVFEAEGRADAEGRVETSHVPSDGAGEPQEPPYEEIEARYDEADGQADDESSRWSGATSTAIVETELFDHLADRYALLLAVARGQRDANRLADVVFHRRHPERGGAPIDPSEPGAGPLIAEWLEIRRSLVNPLLAQLANSQAGTTRPTTPSLPAESGSWSSVRSRAVDIALDEMRLWGNGVRKEWESGMAPVIKKYWCESVGWVPDLKPNERLSNRAWSAVFVSWVMVQAGATPAFRPRGAHWLYVRDALEGDQSRPVQAFDPIQHRPRPGDILVKWRDTRTTLDRIRTAPRGTGIKTHGDIVVEVQPSGLRLVGGNVSNSVKGRPSHHLDGNGFWNDPDGIAIVRIGQ
jgi:hypothetical protein